MADQAVGDVRTWADRFNPCYSGLWRIQVDTTPLYTVENFSFNPCSSGL